MLNKMKIYGETIIDYKMVEKVMIYWNSVFELIVVKM